MNRKRQHLFRSLLFLGTVALTVPQLVLAAATPPAANNYTKACTTVTNTANLTYKVNGVDQTGVNTGTCTTGNGCAFVVGNRINLLVQSNDAANVTVLPSSTNQQLSFLLSNTGNARQTYLVSFVSKTGGAGPFGGTDSFNMTNPGAGSVSTASYTTAVVDPDTSINVTINADTPGAPANLDLAVYALLAETRKVDGSAETANNGDGTIENSLLATCTAAIVYADTTANATTIADGDSARDAKASARGAYIVQSSNLTFSKTATTIWDPINGDGVAASVTPKAIPGALIRYVISISNAAAATTAALQAITDGLPSNVTLDPDLKVPAACATPPCLVTALAAESANGKGFKAIVTGTTRTGAAGSPLANNVAEYYTTASDADGVEFVTPNITLTAGTLLPTEAPDYPVLGGSGQLKGGEILTLTFNVTVN